uniref:Integrase catalytic domain-containing protein n=1 Tax=Knipowitschia caucasica TaxID=637954 RepID=A0AAV2MPS7_KNICA
MVSNYRVPPKFDEARPYECWKNEVSIWRLVTELDKTKQALAVALGLEGRARETALEISAVDLNKDDGMETLLAKLDAVFLREEKDRAYEAYSHFDSITKGSALSMADYIIDFEQRYNRMKKYNMTLPDAVLAFKLLDTACLEEKSRQLALTACTELTFASMKSALKRIFGGKTACGTNAIEEIQDGAFFTEQRPNVKFKRSNGSSQSGYQRQQQGTNPLDKYADIPLLLSKTSLKRAGTILDMENDRVVMFKQTVPLELTSSGHYCVDIRDEHAEVSCNESQVLVVTGEMSTKEKRKVLLKLHKQFGHASAERLQKLIQSSGNTDQDCPIILQEIIRDCEICQRYSRSKPKPAVGLPLASQYNETVAMDLHELEPGVWYLHIIDHFTRFSAGNIVRTKKPSEIVNLFIHSWISVHGAPKRIYTDNGGEFNNAEIRDMAENFNIETKTTAGYSPWSNGLLERHNMTLTEILLKMTSFGQDLSSL